MKVILAACACALLSTTIALAQGVPINTIASSHPTEVEPPPAPVITVEGRWRLEKLVKGPTVVQNDSEFGYPMVFATPGFYVGQILVRDGVPLSSKRKEASGESFALRKYGWRGAGNEPLPPGSGGCGTISGLMDLYSWIHLVKGDGSAGYLASVRVTCPELSVDEAMIDGQVKGTTKKKLFSIGANAGGGSVMVDIETAVANGFYAGLPSPPRIFGGMKDNLRTCTVLQSTGVSIEGWADGSPFVAAAVKAFTHGGSTYTLALN